MMPDPSSFLHRIGCSATVVWIVSMGLFRTASAQQPIAGFAVAELFTSQSDQNGPAAGEAMKSLQQRYKGKNVYFLEYHVDYWNKAGWKDPYSRNPFTLRQENYSRVLPGKELYTPQLVVNGIRDMTVTDQTKAVAAVDGCLTEKPALSVQIKTDSVTADTAYVRFTASSSDRNYAVRIALVQEGLSNPINGGPNKGKPMYQGPVVRRLVSTAMTDKTGVVKIPLDGFSTSQGCSLIGFVQHKQTMKVLCAAGCPLSK
jgi:hypothetical protein